MNFDGDYFDQISFTNLIIYPQKGPQITVPIKVLDYFHKYIILFSYTSDDSIIHQ